MSQPSSSFFNPLTIPYLPDTYFPYAKRSLNHRPFNTEVDMENLCVKRPRVGMSPVEHTELAAVKKLERQTLRKQSNVCATHRTMIDMPVHILKYLQSQGMILNRTNEAMDLLSTQVTDLTGKLEFAIKKFSQPTTQPTKQNSAARSLAPDRTLLTSYYSIIVQTLQKFKRFREAEINRNNSTNSTSIQSSSAQRYDTIRTTFDCISKIRDLIMVQCNFDCSDGINASIMWPVTPGNVTLAQDSRAAFTWDAAYKALLEMEVNLRTYMECLGIFDGRSVNASTRMKNTANFTQSQAGTSNTADSTQARMLNTTTCTPHPLFTSTPRKNVSSIIKLDGNNKKRKSSDSEMEFYPDHNSTFSAVGTRKKLNSKRISFFYERGDKMETD